MRFNTAIAAMMEFTNHLTKLEIRAPGAGAVRMLLSPFAPHLAEELWRRSAQGDAGVRPGPVRRGVDPRRRDRVPVQINGSCGPGFTVPANITMPSCAKEPSPTTRCMQRWRASKYARSSLVPKKLVNIVAT